MLRVRGVVEGAGTSVRDVHCSHERGAWSDPEPAGEHALVLVLRGTFRRRVDRGWQVLDPNHAYFQQAGQEQQFMHAHAGGDRCLTVGVPSEAVRGELPVRAFPAPVSAARFARLLAIVSRSGGCTADVHDGVSELVARSLSVARGESHSPRAAPSRERVAAEARDALVADPRVTLAALAAGLGCSADHLGRAVAESTGTSFSAYRRRLRVKFVVERIGEGEVDLTRLAADAGFADHPHLTRSIRADLGMTPTELRRTLAPTSSQPVGGAGNQRFASWSARPSASSR